MRRIVLFFLALSLAVPAASQADIQFLHGTYKEALKKAQEAKKPLFIDFFATWCRPCKMLAANTFTDANVTLASEKFVCLKLDVDKEENKAVSAKWKVEAYPTILFISPEEKEIDRAVGYFEPADFLAVLRDVTAGRNTLEQVEGHYQKNPESAEAAYLLAQKLMKRNEMDRAEPLFDKTISLDPEGKTGTYADDSRLTLAQLAYRRKEADKVEKHLNAIIGRRPLSPLAADGAGMLASFYNLQRQPDKALKVHHDMMEAAPENPRILSTYALFAAQNRLELDQAQTAIKKALELQPKWEFYDVLAEVNFARKDYQGAVDAIQKALGMEAENSYLTKRLGNFQTALEIAKEQKKKGGN